MDRVVLRRGLEFKDKPTFSADNNLLRLKRISQSFEDLTSETLYSKWKKARQNSAKTDRRNSLISLSDMPEEAFNINGTGRRRRATNSSAATLQREIFRPRGWTVCSGELPPAEETFDTNGNEVYAITDSSTTTLERELRPRAWTVCSGELLPPAEEAFDINGNEAYAITQDSSTTTLERELRLRAWSVCSGELSRYNNKCVVNASDSLKDCLSERYLSPTEADRLTNSTSSENLDDDDIFSSTTSKPEQKDTIETRKFKIITEIIAGTTPNPLRKVRSFSESDRRCSEVCSVRCRLISVPSLNSDKRARSQSCREPREIEFLRTAELVQRYLDKSKMAHEDVWQKRSSSGDSVVEGRHKRMSHSSVTHATSEVNNACNIQEASLGFPNDRSQPDASKRYVLGCTYALIRQAQITQSNSQDFTDKLSRESPYQTSNILTRTMSVPSQGLGKKELRSTEEKERDDRTVKFKDVDVSDINGSHQSHGVRRAQTLPRLPKRPLATLTSKNWKESELKTRKGAEDLIKNINNSNDKSAQERVDIVETAFEWIRKEVADLRAQDKDIMRMFTKIQAGIRHIKFDQSALMESEEEFISTPDLSHSPPPPSTSAGPVVTVPVHRRASLL